MYGCKINLQNKYETCARLMKRDGRKQAGSEFAAGLTPTTGKRRNS